MHGSICRPSRSFICDSTQSPYSQSPSADLGGVMVAEDARNGREALHPNTAAWVLSSAVMTSSARCRIDDW